MSPSFSTNSSLCRWFNSGFRCSYTFFPDRTSVKSETGFRAKTTDSITVPLYLASMALSVLFEDQLPEFVLKLFLAPISNPAFYSMFPNE